MAVLRLTWGLSEGFVNRGSAMIVPDSRPHRDAGEVAARGGACQRRAVSGSLGDEEVARFDDRLRRQLREDDRIRAALAVLVIGEVSVRPVDDAGVLGRLSPMSRNAASE